METAPQDIFNGWGNLLLLWLGFGTIVGLVAKALMPGKDSGGPVATVLIGIVGAIIGSGMQSLIWPGEPIKPLSLMGFAVATIGAFVLLFFHRLLNGSFFRELGTGRVTRTYTTRRRRANTVIREE